MKILLSIIFSFTMCFYSLAQLNVSITINSGTSGTTCTDGVFGGGPELQWNVVIAGQIKITYPKSGACFTELPNTQYNETFACSSPNSHQVLVCFTAFEDDGSACFASESCMEQICQNFLIPSGGSSVDYDLSIPNDGINTSWGSVNFTINSTGSLLDASNFICDAIDLGILNSGSTLGNNGLSSYSNFCSNNLSEPSPWGGNNDQGVWFQFTTGNEPGTFIEILANSDPENLGDDIDLQLALYESSTGDCNGALTLIEEDYEGLGQFYDEDMRVHCLEPNTMYFLLVDGEAFNILTQGGIEGYFGLQLVDNGIAHPHPKAPDFICDALSLGIITEGGTVGTPSLSQSNFCASNIGEANPSAWINNQGVWYSFIAPNSGHVYIEANSDQAYPTGLDAIDLELAVYGSSDGNCSGVITEVTSGYDDSSFNEELDVPCLVPGAIYWVLVDGSNLVSSSNQSGIFDLSVSDAITVTIPNSGTDLVIACDSLVWMDGNTYYSSNNSATHILTNITGCDSVITLDLTILYSSVRKDIVTACHTFTWVDGNTYTNSTNTSFEIMGGAASGCDSTTTLDLTIFNPGEVVGEIVYVDTGVSGGLGNGSSWANALTDLQFAIDLAKSCNGVNEIRVASGTYLPTESPDESESSGTDRKNAFHLDSDVIIKGSYNPSTDIQDYNDPSILSGDFNNNDVNTGMGPTLSITNNSENTYHVLIATNLSNATIIDGFTIKGGNANGVDPINYNSENIPSTSGGGMVNVASSATVTNIVLMGNSSSLSGGGMYNINASPVFTNAVFVFNKSDLGGAIYNEDSSPTLTNTTYYSNSALTVGGIYNTLNSSPSLNNSVFFNNVTDIGNVSGGSIVGSNNFSESFVQSGFTTLTSHPFNDILDPDGVDNLFGTEDDGLLPAQDSPLREAGDNNVNSLTVDITGQPRLRKSIIDAGAYEGRCILSLTLGMDDSPLSGIYQAEQKIIINGAVQIMPNDELELNAPLVQFNSQMNIASEAVLTIDNGACN